jgi:excinuclease UvrABC ATPase subunit
MPTLARPEVDVLDGLTTAIIVDQQRMGADPRSTVGTATEANANAMLRILFSRLGQPHIGSPTAFAFNVPSVRASGAITIERGAGKTVRQTFTRTGGMCPRCEGRGTVSDIDLTQLFDDSKSLAEGAITIPGYKVDGWWTVRIFTESGLLDPDKPIRRYTKKELHDFLHREPTKVKVNGVNLTYEGLIPKVQKSFLSKDKEAMQSHIRAFVDRAVTFTACPECGGSRLNEAARASRIRGIENDLLLQLWDKGNTVLVVEHKPETIAIADHVIDLGPGAGTAGGTVCFEGTVEGLRASGTITGRHLDDRAALMETVRTPTGTLEIRGATAHNLRDVDVDIPLGVLVVVTGVAGSGKSSLVHGSLPDLSGPAGADVVSIDQGAIREAFAKANGVKPALFSANSEDACPNCNGAGVIYTDLVMMTGVATTCEECQGKRFQASVLDHHLGGRDISEVPAMSVTEAEEFFGAGEARTPAAHAILDRLADVGLRYLSLGQPLTTLSGGERQRLELATHMAEKGDVDVLDEPTTGLHSPTSSSCSTGSSTPASRSSSSSTTRRSWRTPTGSSTSAPAPATTAAGSSSRAHPPTSSPSAPPSPASTSRPTSAPGRGRRGHRETVSHLFRLVPLGCYRDMST